MARHGRYRETVREPKCFSRCPTCVGAHNLQPKLRCAPNCRTCATNGTTVPSLALYTAASRLFLFGRPFPASQVRHSVGLSRRSHCSHHTSNTAYVAATSFNFCQNHLSLSAHLKKALLQRTRRHHYVEGMRRNDCAKGTQAVSLREIRRCVSRPSTSSHDLEVPLLLHVCKPCREDTTLTFITPQHKCKCNSGLRQGVEELFHICH